MRVTSLGSGSTGNAFLVEAGPRRRTKLLVDAGLKGRLLVERLRQIAVSPSQLQGVLVTHEHSDHIIGLPRLMHRHAIPAISDPRTLEAIEQTFITGIYHTDSGGNLQEAPAGGQGEGKPRPYHDTASLDGASHARGVPCGRPANVWDIAQGNDIDLPGLDSISSDAIEPQEMLFDGNGSRGGEGMWQGEGDRKGPPHSTPPPSPLHVWAGLAHAFVPFDLGARRIIGDIEVQSFSVSHDAVAPCGYLLSAGGCRVCVAIDSGTVTSAMLEMMSQADLLIIESNHDRQLLLNGPYPYTLKQRILSSRGHLSNDQAAEAVLHTWRGDSIRWIWLSHLSQTNNTPAIALSNMHTHIEFAGANPSQVHVTTLPPGMGSVWDSTQLWETPSLWELRR